MTGDGSRSFDPARAGVVALTMAQSAAMEYYEGIVDQLFARAGKLVDRLENKGTVAMRTRPLHRFIGEAISTRTEVLAVLHLLDKPDETWEDPTMDRIYDDLRKEFDLGDRFMALEMKLRSVQESLELLLDVARDRRMLLLEAAIVVLIVVELLVSVVRFGRNGRFGMLREGRPPVRAACSRRHGESTRRRPPAGYRSPSRAVREGCGATAVDRRITRSGNRPQLPGGFPITASPAIRIRRRGQYSATSPGDLPGSATTVSGPTSSPDAQLIVQFRALAAGVSGVIGMDRGARPGRRTNTVGRAHVIAIGQDDTRNPPPRDFRQRLVNRLDRIDAEVTGRIFNQVAVEVVAVRSGKPGPGEHAGYDFAH